MLIWCAASTPKSLNFVQCVATNKPDETEHIAKLQIACVPHVHHKPVLILDVNYVAGAQVCDGGGEQGWQGQEAERV